MKIFCHLIFRWNSKMMVQISNLPENNSDLWRLGGVSITLNYGNICSLILTLHMEMFVIFNVLAEDFCYSACGDNRVQAVPSAINSEKAWSNIWSHCVLTLEDSVWPWCQGSEKKCARKALKPLRLPAWRQSPDCSTTQNTEFGHLANSRRQNRSPGKPGELQFATGNQDGGFLQETNK